MADSSSSVPKGTLPEKIISGQNARRDKIITHSFWIGITITIIIALIFAHHDMLKVSSFLDLFLGTVIRTNQTVTITINGTGSNPMAPENLGPPFIPRFILIWGYIGAAAYVLKVTTIKIQSKSGFDKKYIPDHISRLFIGTAIAIITFFILATGGFFGLTIDFTKISNPALIQYAYGAVAFFSGYSARHIISISSGIIDNVFLHDKRSKKQEDGAEEDKDKAG